MYDLWHFDHIQFDPLNRFLGQQNHRDHFNNYHNINLDQMMHINRHELR